MQMNQEEFHTYLGLVLDSIDSHLAEMEIDIPERPYAAADIFVKNFLRINDSPPPKDYIIQPWFKRIILPISQWYESKYGSKVIERKENAYKGVILFKGDFFQLDIPLTILVPKGESRDLIFPKELLPIERESSFVTNAPNLSPQSADENDFLQSIRTVVNLTRSIHNNVNTAEPKQEQSRELSKGIEVHLQKAVADILASDNQRYLTSYWEIQLAIEKSLKVLIAQANQTPQFTHDLIALSDTLQIIHPHFVQQAELRKFPNHKEVISYRYGKGPQIRKADVYSNYIEALKLIDKLSGKFDRRVVVNNFVVVLGKLPWQE
jgi:HEPN domain-containing protein